MQVCVPMGMTDDEVIAFANGANPAGTENGWQIRRAGNPLLCGEPERVTCEDRAGCCHIMLDC